MLRQPPPPPEPSPPPLVRTGLRGFLELGRFDVVAIVTLVLVAFGLRFASPIFPDFLSGNGGVHALGVGHPYNGSECTTGPDVPVGPPGRSSVDGQLANHKDETECGFVFDEIYFPVDAAKDLRQPAESYFDPEPPLAKLLIAPPIAWWGFTTWTWRVSTTLFGSLLVGVIYLIAMRLRRDRFFAIAAAGFMCLDGLAFVESRTGVIDIIAIFFVALFYYMFLLHWQARTRSQWRITLFLMAAVAGLAFAAKLTALAPLVVAAALILVRGLEPYLTAGLQWFERIRGRRTAEATLWRSAAGRFAVVYYGAAAFLMVAVFCAGYSRYLTIPHDDVYFFTSCDPASSGLGGTAKDLQVPLAHLGPVAVPNPVQAVYNVYEINAASLQYHDMECHGHPYSSRWYTWPVMEHPVLFYLDQPDGSDSISEITNLGNPAVWWLAIPALLFCVWRMTRGPTWWRVALGALGVGSLVAMIIVFNAAVRYHAPANVHTSYTAAQFTAMFHQDPSQQYENARVSPGAGFTIAFALMVIFAAGATLSAALSRRFVPAFIVLGYVTSWMMWVDGNERRVLFFYHGLGMLIFAVLALAYALTALRRLSVPIGSWRLSLAPLSYAALITVVAAFAFFYPIWTAAPLSGADHQMRVWVDGW